MVSSDHLWAWREIRNSRCFKCGNSIFVHRCLTGTGSKKAEIAIIGEAPSFRKNIYEPFSGRSGELLWRVLQEMGMGLDEIYFTNAIKCVFSKPTVKRLRSCKEYLEKELEELKNLKKIVVLGNYAELAILNRKNVTRDFGKVFQKGNYSVLVLMHPAFLLREGDSEKIEAWKNILRNFLTDNYSIKIDYKVVSFREFKEFVENNLTAIDIETTGLDLFNDRIISIASSNEKETLVYIPESTEDIITADIIGHNAKFDVKFLKKHLGWNLRIIFDSMLFYHLVNEEELKGLKYLVRKFFNKEYDIQTKKNLDLFDREELLMYNALDAYFTFRLYNLFKNSSEYERIKYLFEHLVELENLLIDVEIRGVKVDIYKIKSQIQEIELKINKYLSKFEKLGVNPNSGIQVGEYIEKKFSGIKLRKTSKGNIRVDKFSLSEYAKQIDTPFLKDLLEFRGLKKNKEFFDSWLEFAKYDGRIHPKFNITGTVSGRLSCQDPNLQQVPRDTSLRSCIIASEGYLFVEADYSQIELRLMAEYSKDPIMLESYLNHLDLHRKTASLVLGIPENEITKEIRKKAKAINFGLIYGMSAEGLQRYAKEKYSLDWSLDLAIKFREKFFRTYTYLEKFYYRIKQNIKEKGFVESLIGRRRHLKKILKEKGFSEAFRFGVNSPIQSLASDITWYSGKELQKRLSPPKFRILGFVHDAILGEVLPDSLERLLKILCEVAMNPFPEVLDLTVPLEMEVSVGKYWGDKQEVYILSKEGIKKK